MVLTWCSRRRSEPRRDQEQGGGWFVGWFVFLQSWSLSLSLRSNVNDWLLHLIMVLTWCSRRRSEPRRDQEQGGGWFVGWFVFLQSWSLSLSLRSNVNDWLLHLIMVLTWCSRRRSEPRRDQEQGGGWFVGWFVFLQSWSLSLSLRSNVNDWLLHLIMVLTWCSRRRSEPRRDQEQGGGWFVGWFVFLQSWSLSLSLRSNVNDWLLHLIMVLVFMEKPVRTQKRSRAGRWSWALSWLDSLFFFLQSCFAAVAFRTLFSAWVCSAQLLKRQWTKLSTQSCGFALGRAFTHLLNIVVSSGGSWRSLRSACTSYSSVPAASRFQSL